jgi:glycosyltransferase involved in cell wall biosynthesis
MISFIIIGKNESWKIDLCLKSVIKTASKSQLKDYEIIYVDSRSSDDTLSRVKQYKEVKIILLTADINAAIARNVGAEKANGNVLFFIDGDMEIRSSYLDLVYDEDKGLTNDFVSGDWVNYNYTDQKLISKTSEFNLSEDLFENTTGGLFLIKKSKWELVNGMDQKFLRSQDIDLGLRLAQKNIFLLRKKEIGANHHTVAYLNKNRIWKDFFSFYHLYGRSLLYRKHFLNKYIYQRIIKHDYSMVLLILTIVLFFLTAEFLLFIPYFALIFMRCVTNIRRDKSGNILNLFIFYIARDLSTIIGFLLFWPSSRKKVNYKIINIDLEQIPTIQNSQNNS